VRRGAIGDQRSHTGEPGRSHGPTHGLLSDVGLGRYAAEAHAETAVLHPAAIAVAGRGATVVGEVGFPGVNSASAATAQCNSPLRN
jgi:hypothetical protein